MRFPCELEWDPSWALQQEPWGQACKWWQPGQPRAHEQGLGQGWGAHLAQHHSHLPGVSWWVHLLQCAPQGLSSLTTLCSRGPSKAMSRPGPQPELLGTTTNPLSVAVCWAFIWLTSFNMPSHTYLRCLSISLVYTHRYWKSRSKDFRRVCTERNAAGNVAQKQREEIPWKLKISHSSPGFVTQRAEFLGFRA